MANEPTLKIGRDKIPTPVSQVPDHDLQWYANECRVESLRDIAMDELERRGKAEGAPPDEERPRSTPRNDAPPRGRQTRGQQAIQRAPASQLVGASMAEGSAVASKLVELAERSHVVSPATVCGQLPEGCEVAFSIVQVDSDPDNGEIYPVGGGKYGLSKVALDRISAAAGVTWDPTQCRRLDDGRDPRYVHFRAVGRVRNFDGSERIITGEKEMDLRDGSAQIEALYERAKGRKSDGSDRKDPTQQIREMRLHILSHAETKAKLRAVRSLGVKTSFRRDELARPFSVARLMWTGRTNDPELRRLFAEKQADAMIGGTAALYGAQQPRQLAAPTAHPAPPVGAAPADDYDYETHGTGTDDVPY